MKTNSVLILLTFSLCIYYALSCSCLPEPANNPVGHAFKSSHLVFSGVVTNLYRIGGGEVQVEFCITRLWKGPRTRSVIIKTATSSAACGINFEIGSHYLVYASKVRNDYWASLCSRTTSLSSNQAVEDMTILGKPRFSNVCPAVTSEFTG